MYFERGQVELVPSVLGECLKDGFNREEAISAYKLLIQTYLLDDRLEKADSAMLAFLKSNPEYQLSPTDHSSFVHLFNTFTVKPVVQISIHLGTNMPFVTFVNDKTVASEPGSNRYNAEAINLYTSLEARFELNKRLELNVEAGYSQFAITNEREFLGIGKTSYTERQQRIEIPVSATYNVKSFGKFTTYARLGMGTALTLGSNGKATFIASDLNGIDHTGSDINRSDSRISLDMFTQAGAGIKFKTPGGYVFAEIRSSFGFINQTVRGGASSEELRWYYYYVDDDFHINTLNFSIGFTQLFYRASKTGE